MPYISLVEQYDEAECTYDALSQEERALARKLDQAEAMRELARHDVKTLQEDLNSAKDSSDESFSRDELCKDREKLIKARREARQAFRRHREAKHKVQEQFFMKDHLKTLLGEKPTSPWARRQGLHRRQRLGYRILRQAQPSQIRRVCDWRRETGFCFEAYSEIASFPTPPKIVDCSQDCQAGPYGHMNRCKCNIEACFRLIPGFNPSTERFAWHSDKFSACPEKKRDTFRSQAEGIFVVLQNLHLAQSGAMICK